MGTIKEELKGILTLAFEVKEGIGLLQPNTPVRLTGINEYEVEPYVGPGQPDFMPHVGYVLIPNDNTSVDSKVTVATRARAVQRLVVGEAIGIGKPVTFNSEGKLIQATFRDAYAVFRVLDFMWDGGEKLTIEGQTIQEGFEFFTGMDIPTTAQNIRNAIDTHIDGYRAEADGEFVYVFRDNDGPGFINTIPEISTTDEGTDIMVDETMAQEGDFSIMDPYGLALTGAAAPDETIEVLVL